ncbi:Cytochrome P450 domain-containing protein [Rozella allomycis CSF55]|uniref:Cytochrome P450 domain-containing protein n=1 Tax=Rozella allomycis (strain CSF55) TaxID=988480 RepID=A0A075AQB0_ROZAC|nr:Cytochrome P450 domain-containing protein [Rozella allomycis CSF55]|eukprot:EPZ30787.1 Cytochrome P450 domain-containing protein [Rozella allomycis CSF55]
MACALYLLAKYPDVQEKARREVNFVIGDQEKDYIPSIDQLKDFNYLSCVIKETMRLYPSVATLPLRKCVSDTKLGNLKIPAGCFVSVAIYSMQHKNSNYEKPDDFIPERFYDEHAQSLKQPLESLNEYRWVPFSGGSRICIGMQFSFIEQKKLYDLFKR